MRVVKLLLALLPLMVSCGRLPSAPATAEAPSPLRAPAGSAHAPWGGAAELDAPPPALPMVHSIRVERAGDDVRVALVGRPRSPGAHPAIGPLEAGGYKFWFHMSLNEPDQGNIYSISIFPLDERHIGLMFIPFSPAGSPRDANPAYSAPYELFPLRGSGTSWGFRFPLSTAASLGGFRFLWHLVLDSGTPGAPGYAREDFFGTVDLSK